MHATRCALLTSVVTNFICFLAAGDLLDPIQEGFTPEGSPFEDYRTEAYPQTTTYQGRQTFDDDNFFAPLDAMDTDTKPLNHIISPENKQNNE